jgi:hypothetical protein
VHKAAQEACIEEKAQPGGQAQPGEHFQDWTCHIKHGGHEFDGTGVR